MKDPALLVEQLRKFRDERDWKQFHNHKDMALSMVLEAAEVLEHFQWKNSQEVEEYGRTHRDAIAEELADTLKYLLQLADNLGIKDIVAVAMQKFENDGKKYPPEKARGKHTKYTQL